MRQGKRSMQILLTSLGVAWVILAIGCAGAPETQQPVSPQTQTLTNVVPTTLAILPFENNSVTEPEKFTPLTKGLAAMLTTDLKQSSGALRLIERDKIQALLKEVALGQTGSVDQATAVRVGKILGAQSIAFGAFMVLGEDVRIDVRIVNVETSELITSESIDGKSDNFIVLERNLARKIAGSLKVAFQPEEAESESDIDAAVYYSKGLDALDRGDKTGAAQFFRQSIDRDPTYEVRVNEIGGLNP